MSWQTWLGWGSPPAPTPPGPSPSLGSLLCQAPGTSTLATPQLDTRGPEWAWEDTAPSAAPHLLWRPVPTSTLGGQGFTRCPLRFSYDLLCAGSMLGNAQRTRTQTCLAQPMQVR